MGEQRYVYGFGRTKHIYGKTETARNYFGRGYVAHDFGLCGAAGGFPDEEPQRPVCKRCLRMATPAPTPPDHIRPSERTEP
jgi:hypothetical protein